MLRNGNGIKNHAWKNLKMPRNSNNWYMFPLRQIISARYLAITSKKIVRIKVIKCWTSFQVKLFNIHVVLVRLQWFNKPFNLLFRKIKNTTNNHKFAQGDIFKGTWDIRLIEQEKRKNVVVSPKIKLLRNLFWCLK